MSRLPENLSVVHQTGNKSFCEVLQNNKKIVFYKEALPGKQLDLATMKIGYQTAMGLAKMHPDTMYQYTRYDIEGTPETESNRPFREGAMTKLINMFGDIFHSSIGGKHD